VFFSIFHKPGHSLFSFLRVRYVDLSKIALEIPSQSFRFLLRWFYTNTIFSVGLLEAATYWANYPGLQLVSN